MKSFTLAWLPILFFVPVGCVAHIHREDAALRMSRPDDRALAQAADPTASSGKTGYPSIGGDILKGTSPAELAAARAAASEALTRALAKP